MSGLQAHGTLRAGQLTPHVDDRRCATLARPQVNHALKLNCWVNTVERQRFSPPYVDKDSDEASWGERGVCVGRGLAAGPPPACAGVRRARGSPHPRLTADSSHVTHPTPGPLPHQTNHPAQKFEYFLERLQEALTPDGIEELRWVRTTPGAAASGRAASRWTGVRGCCCRAGVPPISVQPPINPSPPAAPHFSTAGVAGGV